MTMHLSPAALEIDSAAATEAERAMLYWLAGEARRAGITAHDRLRRGAPASDITAARAALLRLAETIERELGQ